MKKLISVLICVLMIFNILPVKTFAEEQNLEEIIRPQVEAFAKSIDKKDADGKALDTLISHGISGNGKKLSVGKNHALTATIVNSELAKKYLTVLCAEMIGFAEELNMDEIYSLGMIKFFFEGRKEYRYSIYDYDAKRSHTETPPEDFIKRSPYKIIENGNGYDESLKTIGGHIAADIDLEVSKVYEDKIVYDVNAVFWDVFDFSAENGSTLEKLLGVIGLILFEPFEWESKFTFQIEIPIEKPEENIVFGDSDGNGSVDVTDAYFARLVAAKLVVPTEEQLAFCDVDSDGKITAIDANLIRKYAVGIIKELPVK